MDSLACSVLQKNLERLKSSTVDPALFACKLRVEGIISDTDVEGALNKSLSARERWGDLVLAIIMKTTSEGTFHKFVNALLGERELKELGKEMKGMSK